MNCEGWIDFFESGETCLSPVPPLATPVLQDPANQIQGEFGQE